MFITITELRSLTLYNLTQSHRFDWFGSYFLPGPVVLFTQLNHCERNKYKQAHTNRGIKTALTDIYYLFKHDQKMVFVFLRPQPMVKARKFLSSSAAKQAAEATDKKFTHVFFL